MSSPVDAMLRDSSALSDADVQKMLAASVKLYAERAEASDEPLVAFGPEAGVTATQAMVTVTAVLKAVNLQLFELGMWQAWSGR